MLDADCGRGCAVIAPRAVLVFLLLLLLRGVVASFSALIIHHHSIKIIIFGHYDFRCLHHARSSSPLLAPPGGRQARWSLPNNPPSARLV